MIKGLDTSLELFPFFLITLSAVTAAIILMLISKIGSKDHYLTIINYFMFISSLIGGIASIFSWKQPLGFELIHLFFIGFFGFYSSNLNDNFSSDRTG